MESNINLEISFRFLGLSEEQAGVLKIKNLGAKFGVHFKTKKITGLIPLSESCIPKIREFIEDQNISIPDTDVCISFITEYDSRIVDIPNYVNKAISIIGSKMVLSYTIE